MAERMGRLRQKEVNKREAFLKHVERYLPPALLTGDALHLFLDCCSPVLGCVKGPVPDWAVASA
jgi:hypothetical protein